jgi:hypothetical protein
MELAPGSVTSIMPSFIRLNIESLKDQFWRKWVENILLLLLFNHLPPDITSGQRLKNINHFLQHLHFKK